MKNDPPGTVLWHYRGYGQSVWGGDQEGSVGRVWAWAWAWAWAGDHIKMKLNLNVDWQDVNRIHLTEASRVL